MDPPLFYLYLATQVSEEYGSLGKVGCLEETGITLRSRRPAEKRWGVKKGGDFQGFVLPLHEPSPRLESHIVFGKMREKGYVKGIVVKELVFEAKTG